MPAFRNMNAAVATPASPILGLRHGHAHAHGTATSCASQSTRRSARRSSMSSRHSSRHYWDIGGSIGTGLFVASGRALATGGPASLLLAFSIVGAMLYCTCQALGELAVIFPIAGSFSSWATRVLDPSWGFAMGWK